MTKAAPKKNKASVSISGADRSLSDLMKLLKKDKKYVNNSKITKKEEESGDQKPDLEDELEPIDYRVKLNNLISSLPDVKLAKAFEAVSKIAESELPIVAPALWDKRPKGMNAVAFYRKHWAQYADKGLTRNLIRQLDRKFYQTIAVWLHRQDASEIPDDLKILLETPSDRVMAELAAANIVDPSDAAKAFKGDIKTAERLYQAARRHTAIEPK